MTSQNDIDIARRKKLDTIPKLIRHNFDQWADEIAMSVKKPGRRKKYTWRQYYETIGNLSMGLISLGLEKGDIVCIIGDNEPEWFWGEFAVQAAGGIPTGIFIDSTPSEVKYIARQSGAKFAVVKDQKQIDKFLAIKNDLPALKKIVYWDTSLKNTYDDHVLISFNDVVKLGKEYAETNPQLYEQNIESGKGNDIAFVYYTSGKTGVPRGAKMSYRALFNNANNFIARYPVTGKDNLASNFPAAVVSDNIFTIIPYLLTGAVLNFSAEPKIRQYEVLAGEIQNEITKAHSFKRFFYNLLLPVGYKLADSKIKNKTPNFLWRLLYYPSHYLLFRPFKKKLGILNIRFAVTDGSVLSRNSLRFIYAFDVELIHGYASAETGLVCSTGRNDVDFESAGRPTVNTEVRILNSGELLVRSESMFIEYLNDPAKTAEVLIDDWYHTGETSTINEKGHLVFLSHINDVIARTCRTKQSHGGVDS